MRSWVSGLWPLVVSTGYQPYRQAIAGFLLSRTFRSFSVAFAMASTPALPAPGGNASAALALANPTQPEEVVIHSGAAYDNRRGHELLG